MENQGCSAGKSADNSCSTQKTGGCGTEKTGACGGGEKKCCPGTIFKGALVGGMVMFIWFSVSWMMLPWHKPGTMALSNEKMAASLIANIAPNPGIYELPKIVDLPSGAVGPAAVIKPYAFISVYPEGIHQQGGFKEQMGKFFLFCLLGGALLTKVLKKRKEGCCPVAMSVKLGVLVAVFSYLPNIVWYHFPWHWSLAGMADDIIAITLAGAAISCAVLKSAGGCGCGGKCPCPCCSKGSCGDKKTGSCGTGEGSCPVCKCSPCCCKTGSCGDKKTGSCGS